MDTPHDTQPKRKRRETRGRKRKATQDFEKGIIMTCIRAIIAGEAIPSDCEMASRYKVSERTVREIRLKHGLNRHYLKREISEHKDKVEEKGSVEVYTPYAGIWLLCFRESCRWHGYC